MNLLITGFEPFGGREVNLSWEVAREVAASEGFEGRVKAVRLPVSFGRTPVAVREAMRLYRPDVVLMLGFSAKREKINVERVAVNVMDAKIPDNDGVRPTDVPVAENAPAAIFATLPIRPVLSAIVGAGIDAAISNSAGTYVCNTAFYSALRYAGRLKNHPLVGFVHLPDMDKDEAVKAIKAVVESQFNLQIK